MADKHKSLPPETVKRLKKTVDILTTEQSSTTVIEAMGHIAELSTDEAHYTIDVAATDAVGSPVIYVEKSNLAEFLTPLTNRQKEVATKIIEGHSNKQIARLLNISPATVKDHVHAILKALQLTSRTQLIAAANSFR